MKISSSFEVRKIVQWSMWIFYGVILCLGIVTGQNDGVENDKPFTQYYNELQQRYKYKDYLAAIFENSTTREEFTQFVNSGLTQEVKNDLRAVRLYKNVNGRETPMIAFNFKMDSWLGVLPQWKRIKKFLFGKMRDYVDAHPDILESPYVRTVKPRSQMRW